MRFLTAVALALVMLWVPVDGVAQFHPLTGLLGVGLEVRIQWDNQITQAQVNEAQFTREVEDAFELGIRRLGLEIGIIYDAYLYCRAQLMAFDNGNVIVFRYEADLRQRVLEHAKALAVGSDLDKMMGESFYATTWSKKWVGAVGKDNLRGWGTRIGQNCAEDFAASWRSWNN